jgi:hypothetical protein
VRVEQHLAWDHQKVAYLEVYRRLTRQPPSRAGA